MLSSMSVFAKLLGSTHSAIEVAFYRNVIAAIPFAVWFVTRNRFDSFRVKGRLDTIVYRSVIGTVSIIATFKALTYLPMGDAQALFFTSSLFVPIMGYFLLKEKVGPYRWGAVTIGFVGMLIIVHPTGEVNMAGVGFAVAAALMHSGLGTLLRVLGRTERPETVTFYFLCIGALLTAPAIPFVAVRPTWQDAPLFLGLGLTGAAAQMLLSTAYKYAPMALVTIFNYTAIIWATAYGFLIWGDWPGPAVWTGAGIIVASSLFIVWRENRLMRLAQLQATASPAT